MANSSPAYRSYWPCEALARPLARSNQRLMSSRRLFTSTASSINGSTDLLRNCRRSDRPTDREFFCTVRGERLPSLTAARLPGWNEVRVLGIQHRAERRIWTNRLDDSV